MLTGSNAQISAAYSYDAWGSVYGERPVVGVPRPVVPAVARPAVERGTEYLYTGKRLDAETGLADYGFRDYAPALARFTTTDPIRDGRNWFAYVEGDPVNKIDLWGLETASDGEYASRIGKSIGDFVLGAPLDFTGVVTAVGYVSASGLLMLTGGSGVLYEVDDGTILDVSDISIAGIGLDTNASIEVGLLTEYYGDAMKDDVLGGATGGEAEFGYFLNASLGGDTSDAGPSSVLVSSSLGVSVLPMSVHLTRTVTTEIGEYVPLRERRPWLRD